MDKRINFPQLCKSDFCNYSITFKIFLDYFDQKTAVCISNTNQRNFFSFICPKCLLQNFVDFDVEFYRQAVLSIISSNTFYPEYVNHVAALMTLTGKTCVVLNSVQKFIKMQGWLLLTFFICLHNQLILLIPLLYRCLKNVIDQIHSKNKWLLLSVNLTTRFELVFVFKHFFLEFSF